MTNLTEKKQKTLKVAIIGGGPAGLSAAIELSKVPNINWTLYEQKPEISEIGTGISLQRNTWRLLEHMEAAKNIQTSDFFRPADGHEAQYRNGRTGVVVKHAYPQDNVALHQTPCRIHRAKLQQALLKQLEHRRNNIQTDKKLIGVAKLPCGRLRIAFQDGSQDQVDLLVGADGIRSFVRGFNFPGYQIRYAGATTYRAVVKTSEALEINGITRSVTFWYGTGSKWIYTCPLDGDDFEITCRNVEPDEDHEQKRSSWGQDVGVDVFLAQFGEFCEPVQRLLRLVQHVKRYDYFGGNRLETVIGPAVALIGDASHPLSGAFGAGAAFAIEDAYVLAGALSWAAKSTGRDRNLSEALELFDSVRSPHYKALYQTLDEVSGGRATGSREAHNADEDIVSNIAAVSKPGRNWMYYYEVDHVLEDAINRRQLPGSKL